MKELEILALNDVIVMAHLHLFKQGGISFRDMLIGLIQTLSAKNKAYEQMIDNYYKQVTDPIIVECK